MDRDRLRLLQNLQDTYSAAYKLSIISADSQGMPLTQPSLTESGEALVRLLKQLEGHTIYDAMIRQAPFVREIQAVTKYDYETFLDMKYIVAPLKLPGEPNGTIWAGPWLGDGSREFGRIGADACRALPGGLSCELDSIPAAHSTSSSEPMARVREFAELAAAILKRGEDDERRCERQLAELQSFTRWTSTPAADMDEEEALRFMQHMGGFDVVGYAGRIELERFEIAAAAGERSARLIGQSFHSGEGCLGHAALIRKRTTWELASGRAGASLFSEAGCELDWLVGYPVCDGGVVRGVLFGGMAASRRPSPLMLELLHVLANRWGDYLQGSGLRAVQKRQALLLSMLGEIHDSVGAIQDLDRLLSVTVETMHRLTGGVFSGLSLFGLRGRAEEVQMVSKGLNAEQVARYAGELSERYLALESKAGRPKDRKPVFRKTGWGVPALEIPLYDGRRIAGVLSAGLSEKRAGEAERFFLSSLALIGELRLFELRQQEPASGRNALELLGHSFSFWDPEAHSSLLRKRDLLAEFAGRLGFSSEGRKRLDQALTVSGYGMSFLWETIPGHADVLLLLDEAQSVIAHRSQADAYLEFGYSQEAQALALVIGHPGADGGIQSVALGLRAAFEELLEDRMPSVSLVAVGNAWTRRDEEEPAYATLTLREREVLELLIQGCTNQDIAEKMFISAHTVKNHLTKIYMKLGVVDRTAAMVKLLRN